MSRLPIRVRLALAFALAMAVVLAATGAFLYLRLGSSLDEAVNEGLQARSAEVARQVRNGERVTAGGDPDERFVQILDARGEVVAATGVSEPLLGADTLARARGDATWLVLDDVNGVDGRVRILATPFDAASGTRVLVVGSSLEDRDDAARGLLALLIVVGPAALLVASLLGYGLATLALRPVESMRIEASVISASEPGRRLPLPPARDEIFRLGETLNRMLDRLESALERERRFVADASHELRTPIALLKTELELALRRPRSEAELDQALRSAAAEADRLARLSDDLLLLARSDEGALALDFARIPAWELLAATVARFERRAKQANRTVELDAPDALEVRADRLRVEQALANLVDNALRHGGGAILLAARESNGHVQLHVLDEGSGFGADYLPHAFERFTREDAARSGEGAGLGLTIADVIARAHGGSARAANRTAPGGGADVWISLPAS
jgi:signal transduction histidine kinase